MNFPKNKFWLRIAFLAIGAVMAFWACQLTQNGTKEDTVSFTKLYDQLSAYDSVVIVFNDRDGVFLDTVYQGKVDHYEEIEHLPVKNWDGGMVLINIVGFKDGVAVYQIEKRFDGNSNQTDTTFIVYEPGTKLTTTVLNYDLMEGDTLDLPTISISTQNLTDKSLVWSPSNSEIVGITQTHILALRPGNCDLTVSLHVNPSINLVLKLTVLANTNSLKSLRLSPESLFLAANGPPGQLILKATPSAANRAVTWEVTDGTIVKVSADGSVSGLMAGTTTVKAISIAKPSIFATVLVVVSPPIPVEGIRFLKDSVDLYIRGASESLLVEVLPPKANPAVDFVISNSFIASLTNGKLTGMLEGTTLVTASSRANPLLTATLKVHVWASQVVDSVRISPRTLKLYVGGESPSLSAQVFPASASPKIQWTSGNSALATVDASGKVNPIGTGNVKVYAKSLADSSKRDSVEVNVKVDAPKLSIGQDTTLSVGQTVAFLPVVAPQEFGQVVQFKWDLNGDSTWDDSSANVKSVSYNFDQEKTYAVRFYVRDTEGNETIAAKKVSAVKGPVINILSPANNSYSRVANITVVWKVDDVVQDSLNTATLKDGANTLTRTVKDAAGKPFSAFVKVTLDSLAPNKPVVTGPVRIASTTPTWTWTSGGAGGNGIYRTALDLEDFAATMEVNDTLFKPATNLAEGNHTLFVQERDLAGNWSVSGKWTLRIDVTPPQTPDVKVSPAAISNLPKPTWTWTSVGGGSGTFQYKLDDNNFASGAVETGVLSFVSLVNMTEGLHTLYVREKDSTGNWSAPGEASITLDFTPPNPPNISGASPTSLNPKWDWTSGGKNGSGDFRFHMGTDPTAADAETKALTYTHTSAVSGTTYTLYVQERDAAGNWSTSSNLPIKFDLTKPTVTIQAPLASGTYISTLATYTLSGSYGGPNAITAIAYTVAGGTGGNAILTPVTNSWSIASIPIAAGLPVLVTVTATDALGNTGEAQLSLQRDNSAPTAPISLVFTLTSPTNVSTNSWTWAAATGTPDGANGSGLNGQYRYNLNGSTWVVTSTTAANDLTMAQGSNLFSVQEQDKAANWSASTTSTVVLDIKIPDAVTFTGTENAFTTNTKPTWTWTPSSTNGGLPSYELTLDANAPIVQTATSFTPGTALSDNTTHTLSVRQQDQVAGVWGTSKSFRYQIIVNAPAAPDVNGPSGVLNNGLTNQIDFSWVGGARGNGIYQVKVNSETTARQTSGQTNFNLSPGDKDGTYTIHVQEQDGLNRWGTEGTFTIQLDRTMPTISVTYPPRNNFLTNKNSLSIAYSIDNVAQPNQPCTLTKHGDTANTCTISAQDLAGNTTETNLTIYSRPGTYFITMAGGALGKDGSSWDEAGTAGMFNDAETYFPSGSTIWLSDEDYYPYYIFIRTPLTIYGGFNAGNYPFGIGGRKESIIYRMAFDFSGKAKMDGVQVTDDIYIGTTDFTKFGTTYLTMTNCSLKRKLDIPGRGIEIAAGAKLTANNLIIENNVYSWAAIDVCSDCDLVLDGGSISGNQVLENSDYTLPITMNGSANLIGNLKISGNKVNANIGPQIQLGEISYLYVDPSVDFDCTLTRSNTKKNGFCNGSSLP